MNQKFFKEDLTRMAEETLHRTKDLACYKQALTIILLNKYGYSVREAADVLQCDPATISRHRQSFSQTAFGVKPEKEPRNGNGSYLTLKEEQEIIDKFAEQAHSGEITVITAIKEEYEKLVEHQVADSTIYRMLKRHGWRKVSPRPKHPEADREAQEAFKKNSPISCSTSRKRQKGEKSVSCSVMKQASG